MKLRKSGVVKKSYLIVNDKGVAIGYFRDGISTAIKRNLPRSGTRDELNTDYLRMIVCNETKDDLGAQGSVGRLNVTDPPAFIGTLASVKPAAS